MLRLANVPLILRCVHNERSGNSKASDIRVHVFVMYVDKTKKAVASYLSLQTVQSMLNVVVTLPRLTSASGFSLSQPHDLTRYLCPTIRLTLTFLIVNAPVAAWDTISWLVIHSLQAQKLFDYNGSRCASKQVDVSFLFRFGGALLPSINAY